MIARIFVNWISQKKLQTTYCGLKKSPQPSLYAISRFWRKFVLPIIVNQSEAISTRTRYFKRLRRDCTCERSTKPRFCIIEAKCSFNRLKMERNSFKEYSVLAMVSKEEQRPMKACYNFFHLDRVIAWLDEVAKVAHNNTSRSELNFGWEH